MNMNEYFKCYVYISALPEADYRKYYLIKRYYDKVSDRLKFEAKSLEAKGKTQWEENMKFIEQPTFLKRLKPDPNWQGGLYVYPIHVLHGAKLVTGDD